MRHNVPIICVRWGVTPPKIINITKFKNMQIDSKKHETPADANNVLVAGRKSIVAVVFHNGIQYGVMLVRWVFERGAVCFV